MSTRVSKQTAILLKEAGYDVPCGFAHPVYGTNIIAVRGIDWNNPKTTNMYYSAPTLHEVADWERSKGVHVCVFISVDRKTGKPFWYFELVDLKTFKYIREGVGSLTFDTFEAAYEAGIVHGLKYIK